MKTKRIREQRNNTVMKRIHKSLASDIKNIKKKLQREADNRYGNGKVKITEVFASKVISRRLKK